MKPQRYRALRTLYYPTDPEVLRRLAKGENLRMSERQHTKAPEGEIVDDLPEASIPVLLRKGWIERVTPHG